MSDSVARLAQDYDAVPYDPVPDAALDLAPVRGAAAANGLLPGDGPVDVLDLGCGTGGMLLRLAEQGSGRLVGIDVAESACATARSRVAHLGPRAAVLHGDATAMGPEVLGRFDVIYLVGVLYILPPALQSRLLAVAAACLKPGGVLAFTGYVGPIGLVRGRLCRLLRETAPADLPPAQRIALARNTLSQLRGLLPEAGLARAMAEAQIEGYARGDDVILYHEALGPGFTALDPVALEQALAEAGLVFLNYLRPAPVTRDAPSRARALAADAWDFGTGGGYRTLLFGRPGAAGAVWRDARLAWTTGLVRADPAAPLGGTLAYADPARGGGVTSAVPAVQAMLDGLAERPLGWAALTATVHHRLAASGIATGEGLADQLEEFIGSLWHAHLIAPHWQG